ncbi:adenosylcobinamide-GDP ribazoletransferase [Azoarcus olearius]|uniref:Adenosylcobinamide-GDP ribazoletransferase n=1 Tax=Azoarcus sp. (strain BH72) TaxID=418699 RepID=A1KBH1_AZOSB|nr:adenosylcobinamide-GDP ribazoletransferase [Azoarcus olearius]ANQ86721.1 cobalamin synthase [Azoarcus olearius]CAL96177.1 cobalamin (5'-phosphate) synthase [Azoarcus olearius]
MRSQLELFFTALGYFSRLPVPAWVAWSPQRAAAAARYFPLVGWIVGAAAAAAYALAALVLPPAPAVVIALAAAVLLTGALHEDGWADACDGLGGGWAREQVLAIMKDSRIGSYGALGLMLMLLAKAATLVELAAAGSAAFASALLAAHALSRLAATALMQRLPYARSDDSSKSRPLAQPLDHGGVAIASACGVLPLLLVPGAAALAALATTALLTFAAARYFLRRLGGYTGDLLGATQQLTELGCYLAFLATWNFT